MKPDPNNVYFVNAITGRGRSRRSTSRRVEEGIRDVAKKGYKYPFPFVDLECDLTSRQVPRRGLVAGRVLPVRPRRTFRDAAAGGGHQAAGADHEGGGGLARRSTRGRSPATSTAAAGSSRRSSEDKGVARMIGEGAAGEPVRVHQRPARRDRRARRASRWSSATTPRCRRNWPTCRSRRRSSGGRITGRNATGPGRMPRPCCVMSSAKAHGRPAVGFGDQVRLERAVAAEVRVAELARSGGPKPWASDSSSRLCGTFGYLSDRPILKSRPLPTSTNGMLSSVCELPLPSSLVQTISVLSSRLPPPPGSGVSASRLAR